MTAQDRTRWDQRHRAAPDAAPDAPIGLEVARWHELCRGGSRRPRVLDVACGRGGEAVWFASNGGEVLALDVSPAAIDATRRLAARHGCDDLVDARCHDLDDGLPEGCGPFDVVVCQRFRAPHLYPTLLELVEPGGLAVFTVLSEVGTSEGATSAAGPSSPGRFRARPGELRDLFADAPFEVLVDREADGEATIVARRV
ncbi:MAG: class I SAM-dependent methyltransferase [Ilumatobacteraceae bacterium]